MGQTKFTTTEQNLPDKAALGNSAPYRYPSLTESIYNRKKLSGKSGEFNKLYFLTSSQIQEEERRRISESLHNNLGQLLYVLKLKISKIPLDALPEIRSIESLVDDALETTKNISFELMPHCLKSFGLKSTIEELCWKNSSEAITLNAHITDNRRYNADFEISLYRIIQELINNIVKHSGASMAEIRLGRVNQVLELTVTDNGIGFDLNAIDKNDSMGLQWISYHADRLNANLRISSHPGKGTTVHIKLEGQ